MFYPLHPHQTEIDNVNKMIHCGDPSYGDAFYACPDCGELKFVPFRCKSRFCLPVEICIIRCALFKCPANLLTAFIATVFLPFLKNSALTF